MSIRACYSPGDDRCAAANWALQRQPLFFPVQTHDTAVPAMPAQMERASNGPRQIEIELKNGSRVRVEEGVSLTALRRMLVALRE
jgi:hypothetical protein